MRPKLSTLIKRLVLVLTGLIVGLLLAESLLRWTGAVPMTPYEPDSVLGTRLKPNYSGWHMQENRTFFRTNSAGFRDREHAKQKPADTIRIVVLGDSYCEALQVDLEQTFWSVLERELNACRPAPNRKIEVLNMGVSGYGTAQELLMLRQRGWDYDPDIVLLAFLTGNDIRNNSSKLEADRTRPYFELNDGALRLDNSFREARWIRFKDRLVGSSSLLTLLYRVKHLRDQTEPMERPGSEAGLDDFIYQIPQQQEQQEAWELTERLIEELHSDVSSSNAVLVIVTLTNGIQVHPDSLTRERFAERLGTPDLTYPDRRIATLARRLGCPVVSLVSPMREYAEQHQAFLHGFQSDSLGWGHWNPLGHRLAGQIIADELCSNDELWRQVDSR